jgi:uncharacterized protein YcfJ
VAYRAEIEIAVKGARELQVLNDKIRDASNAVQNLNELLTISARSIPKTFNNVASSLREASRAFDESISGTKEATVAAYALVKAEQAYNAELKERNNLLSRVRASQGPSIRGERLTEGQQRGRESFQAFFADAAQQAKSISVNALNTKTAWDTFFKEAAEVARSFDVQKLNTRTSWNNFFTEAAELANEIRNQTKVKQLNIRTSWNTFFTEAEAVANSVRNQTRVKQLNLRTSWTNFFSEAEAVANDVRNQTRIKQVNLRTSWNNFFTEAAQLAEDLRRQAARTVLRAQERDIFVQETISRGRSARIARERSAFLQGSSGTQQLGPLAGPGTLGFPVALPGLSGEEQKGLEIAKQKLDIVKRTVKRRQELKGLAENLQRLDINAKVAAADANREQIRTNNLTQKQLELEREIAEATKQQAANRKQRRRDAVGSAIIGGAFPLLFGQGGGAAVGGAAGGFGGGLLGGQFGFGLSLVGTQLGTVVDQFVGKITTLAGSLESTESIFSALEQAGFKVNDVTKEIAASYEEAGLFADAYQLAIDELNKKLGDDGAAKLQAYQDELNRVNSLVEDLSSDLMAELLPALTGTLRLILGLKEAFDILAESPLFKLLATVGKNVAFVKPDLLLARAFAENAQRLGAADGDVRIPGSVQRRQESADEQKIADRLSRDESARERLQIVNKEFDLAKAGNDILNKNVQAAKRGIIQETYLAALRKEGITDTERLLAAKERDTALQKLNNQITQAQNRAAVKAQNESDRAAKRAQAEAERAAKRAKQEEERLQQRLTKLRLERDQIAKVTQFKDRIAAAEADSDQLTAARIKGEQRIFEIEQQRLRSLIRVTDQREIDEINITAAAKKLAVMRDTERDMAEIQRQRTQAFQSIIENLQVQLDIATATTREEAEQLRIRQEIESLKGEGFSDDQLNRIKLLKENVNKANQPLNKFITDSTKQLNDLDQVAVNVASGIGDAIGNSLNNAISGLIEGSATVKEVFADMLKSIGQVLVQEGTKMIATYIAIGIARVFAGLGSNPSADGISGLSTGSPSSFGGGNLFDGSVTSGLGGFRSNGGPVNSGRPYMVGERGPELFVPSNNGGVMRNEDMRQLMGRSPVGNAPAMNFTFETTNIGGQEFVSREQLEAAMVTTRRQAASDGAKRGMNMTLDRMQNSPRTRARVGIG